MSFLRFILKKDKARAVFCEVAPRVLEVVMAEKQILINCGKKWFEFSKSGTGQLDYCGKVENPSRLNVENYQKLASSAYFSPGYYVFLQDGLNCTPRIYVSRKLMFRTRTLLIFFFMSARCSARWRLGIRFLQASFILGGRCRLTNSRGLPSL